MVSPRCSCSSTLVGGRWEASSDNGFLYSPASCRLHRAVNVSAVRKCLGSRHVLFYGDSLTRYFYLVLADFLKRGKWPDDTELADVQSESICHMQNASGSEAWAAFFAASNERLAPHEICDCVRPLDKKRLHENRFFRFGDVRLSYIAQVETHEWMPHGTLRLSPSFDELKRQAAKCTPGRFSAKKEDIRWSFDNIRFMREVLVPKLAVTDLVLNFGHHWAPQNAYTEMCLESLSDTRIRCVT